MTTPSTEVVPGSPQWLVQFLHPEKILELGQRTASVDQLLGDAYYGVTQPELAGFRETFAGQVDTSAADMLTDPAFAASVDQLPFAPDDQIVVFGDSLSDDLRSWVSILEAVLQLKGHDNITVRNLAISSSTTTSLLEGFRKLGDVTPQWIFVLIGTNDVKRLGPDRDVLLVSHSETERNLTQLAELYAGTGAKVVWMIPPPIDGPRLRACPLWDAFEITYDEAQVDLVAEMILKICPSSIDLRPAFRAGHLDELLSSDGAHPSLEGQRLILRTLCDRLASTN